MLQFMGSQRVRHNGATELTRKRNTVSGGVGAFLHKL